MKRTRVSKTMAKHVLANVGMVVQKASEAYARLPQHTKNWIDREDFIQEGLLEGMTIVARRYDPSKGTKFSTYLFAGLELFFKNLLEPHYADMRYEGRTQGIDDLAPGWERRISPDQHYTGVDTPLATGSWQRMFSTEERFAGTHYETQPNTESKVAYHYSAERALVALIREASPQLKQMMVKWFIQPKETKFHTDGVRFKGAREEFLALCRRYRITKEDCAAAMQNEYFKAKLAFDVMFADR